MKKYECKSILIGIGNSGRQDDGLGWAFLDKISPKLPPNYDVEYRYQLQIEDAELISHYDQVFFVDAHKQLFKNGVTIEKCFPKETHNFSSHALPPETILYLANNVYHKNPESYIIGINGKHFELEIGLTDFAIANLKKSLSLFSNQFIMQKQIANKNQ